MRKVTFGILRHIEIFEEGEKNDQLRVWENFIEKIVAKSTTMNDFIVFGVVNGMHPLLLEKKTDKIFLYEPIQDKILLIANSVEQFHKIMRAALTIWKDYQSSAFLKREKAIMDDYKLFVAELKAIPNIHFDWWADFAFKELNVNLRF